MDTYLIWIPLTHRPDLALAPALATFDIAGFSCYSTKRLVPLRHLTIVQMSVNVAQTLHADHQYGPNGDLDGLYSTGLQP